MIHEILTSFCSKTFLWISNQKSLDKVLSNLADRKSVHLLLRPADRRLFYVQEHNISIFVIERWDSCEHLISQNAKSPPVSRMIMSSRK